MASGTPAAARRSRISVSSWVSTQRTTSAMLRPPNDAAKRNGASILVAVAYQKSPSLIVPTDTLPTSVNPAAARRAPGQVREAGREDHVTESKPVEPEGSKHRTVPQVRR